MMFSPAFLINRPAPSPRSAHATRFVTSNAPSTVRDGLTCSWMHLTSASLLSVLQPNVGSGGGGGVGSGSGAGGGGGGAGACGCGRRSVSLPCTGPRQVVPEYDSGSV